MPFVAAQIDVTGIELRAIGYSDSEYRLHCAFDQAIALNFPLIQIDSTARLAEKISLFFDNLPPVVRCVEYSQSGQHSPYRTMTSYVEPVPCKKREVIVAIPRSMSPQGRFAILRIFNEADVYVRRFIPNSEAIALAVNRVLASGWDTSSCGRTGLIVNLEFGKIEILLVWFHNIVIEITEAKESLACIKSEILKEVYGSTNSLLMPAVDLWPNVCAYWDVIAPGQSLPSQVADRGIVIDQYRVSKIVDGLASSIEKAMGAALLCRCSTGAKTIT